MTIFQILILILIAVVVYKATRRLIKKDLTVWLYLLWLSLWLVVAVFVVWPGILSQLAYWAGIGRGVDLIIYLAIFGLFYLIFKLNLRLDKMERNISELVRKLAINHAKDKKKV